MGRRGSPLPRRVVASAASGTKCAKAPRPGCEDVPRVAPTEAPPTALSATRSWHEMTHATTLVILAIGPRSVDSHDTVRPTSHRWRRRSQLCSWHTQALSYLQRHRPQQLSITLMSREHTPSSAMTPAMTRLMGGASNTGATLHMTGRREFFTELDSDVRGSIKFGMPPVWRSRASTPSSSPLSLVSTDCSLESTTSQR
jgi:hypothetical protein